MPPAVSHQAVPYPRAAATGGPVTPTGARDRSHPARSGPPADPRDLPHALIHDETNAGGGGRDHDAA